MKRKIVMVAAVFAALMTTSLSSYAEGSKNQVFFRGGYSYLTNARGTEVFTDTLGTTTVNNGKSGYSIGAGLRLGMHEMNWFEKTMLQGEVFLEYSNFSRKTVTQTTSALLGGAATSTVDVTQLNIAISPQLKFEGLGRIKPFIAPVGMAFIVSSPPSDDSTYLDIGFHSAVGVDVEIVDWLSLGADVRYTHGFQQHNTNSRNLSIGAYAGVNF